MPFTSGTVQTTTALLNAMNTHLIANGWTKLRGETDVACISPKAARYWRVLVWETEQTNSDFREIDQFTLYTTLGGPAISGSGTYTSSSVNTGSLASLSAGGANIRSGDINNQPWWVQYDHGSAVTVREIVIQCIDDAYSFRDFAIQWSNDEVTWTTMQEWNAQSWVNNETKTFSFGDTTLYSEHQSGTEPRRSGRAELFPSNTNWTGSWNRQFSEDYWVWQGDGYDASRRVYIHARGHNRTDASTAWLEWDVAVEEDAGNPQWNGQLGTTNLNISHVMTSGEVDYWFYTNSKRMILVTRSGAQDYACSYVGFHSAFAVPDDYPFPLCVFATAADGDTADVADFNAIYSVPDEPGFGSTCVRLWDATLTYPYNRTSSSTTNLMTQLPSETWMWPKHLGNTGRASWPSQWGGDWAENVPPMAWDFVSKTAQDELPFFPATIQHHIYGNIGVLDGLFSVPASGSFTPTQVVTIGGQDYRMFPNRNRRNDSNWFAIRED